MIAAPHWWVPWTPIIFMGRSWLWTTRMGGSWLNTELQQPTANSKWASPSSRGKRWRQGDLHHHPSGSGGRQRGLLSASWKANPMCLFLISPVLVFVSLLWTVWAGKQHFGVKTRVKTRFPITPKCHGMVGQEMEGNAGGSRSCACKSFAVVFKLPSSGWSYLHFW